MGRLNCNVGDELLEWIDAEHSRRGAVGGREVIVVQALLHYRRDLQAMQTPEGRLELLSGIINAVTPG